MATDEKAKTTYLVLKNIGEGAPDEGPWERLDGEQTVGNSDQATAAAALEHGAAVYVAVPKRSFRPVPYTIPEPKPVKAKTTA